MCIPEEQETSHLRLLTREPELTGLRGVTAGCGIWDRGADVTQGQELALPKPQRNLGMKRVSSSS